MHYKTKFRFKKGNSKFYCFIIKKDGKMDGWAQKRLDIKNQLIWV